MAISKGDLVKKGQIIGAVGTTGHIKTPQLHFELRKGKKTVDPMKWV
jgi:murein DD-endopeptidase MepM/ murein hydrolase activator NlpD